MNHPPEHTAAAALALVDSLIVELGRLNVIIPKDRQTILNRAMDALQHASNLKIHGGTNVLEEMYGGRLGG